MKHWKRWLYVLLPIVVVVAGWFTYTGIFGKEFNQARELKTKVTEAQEGEYAKATFAGGCFWCMEPPFEDVPGVVEVISGFTGGEKEDPSYEEVSSGSTEHVEAVQITYNPEQVSYEDLLQIFWRQIDPTDDGGQFVDRGHQYTTGIFYHNEAQKQAAKASRQEMERSGRFGEKIVTPIETYGAFYPAKDYHQDYYKKNPGRYKYYRGNSGRDEYLNKVWDEDERKYEVQNKEESEYASFDKEARLDELSDIQYRVTQEKATEPAFENKYYDNKQDGIYVDVVSGEPLFSSEDKFDSGTGWPSFTKPLEPGNITYKEDRGVLGVRVEVRSEHADSHLGHLFEDGPEPRGIRYCMNSAALEFIPADELKEQGYGQYNDLFE